MNKIDMKVAKLESVVGDYTDYRHIAGRLDDLEHNKTLRDNYYFVGGIMVGVFAVLLWMECMVMLARL